MRRRRRRRYWRRCGPGRRDMHNELQDSLNAVRRLLLGTGLSEDQVAEILSGGNERIERYCRFRFASEQELDAAAARVGLR
jgi:hypothetical protein